MFKNIFKKSLYATLAMSAGIAHATLDLTGWQLVTGDNTIAIYMSPKYINKVGHKKVEAWDIRVYYPNDIDMQMYVGEHDKNLQIYDCTTRSFGLKQWATYTQTGWIKNSSSIPDDKVKMRRVIPQSVGETWLNYACSQFGW